MKKYHLLYIVLFFLYLDGNSFLNAQQNKIPLDNSLYESWKTISNARISNDGKWVTYEINPGLGDGFLYLYNVKQNILDSIERGYDPVFSNQSDFLVFKIKPQYARIRQAKKDEVKKDKMPKDSLGVWMLNGSKAPLKYPDVQSFKVPLDGSGWFAFHHYELPDTSKTDNIKNDTTKSGKPEKKRRGSDLLILNPVSNEVYRYSNVVDYDVARQGKSIGFIQENDDTISVCTVSSINSESGEKLSPLRKVLGTWRFFRAGSHSSRMF